MRRFSFHLRTLLILVLLLCVGFAALRESNETWDNSIFSLALGVLLISILLAIHRTGKQRAFWLGFALLGSAYLGLCLIQLIEPRLITTKAMAFLGSKVQKSIPAGFAYADFDNDGEMDLYLVNNSQPNALYLNKGNGTFQDVTLATWLSQAGPSMTGSSGTTENFVRIGHSLLALIAAILGGLISRHLHAGNQEILVTVQPRERPRNT